MAPQEPVVLELAPLPREKIGPFILLGLAKDATPEEVEAHWAQRVIWARKNQIDIPLENINWARDTINDAERRVKADVTSLNADTSEHGIRRLATRYGVGDPGALAGVLRDREKPVEECLPPVAMPDVAKLLAAIEAPEPPLEIRAFHRLLQDTAQEKLDPWDVQIPEADAKP